MGTQRGRGDGNESCRVDAAEPSPEAFRPCRPLDDAGRRR